MKKRLYSVFDFKARAYGMPFCAATDDEAVRQFSDVARDRSTLIGMHPADFQLYYLGTFDLESGAIVPEMVSLLSAFDAIGSVEKKVEKTA